MLIKFDKESTVVNNNVKDQEIIGFEAYDEDMISQLKKLPNAEYEKTRELIFDLMDSNQEITEYYEEINADKIKEGIMILRAKMQELKM